MGTAGASGGHVGRALKRHRRQQLASQARASVRVRLEVFLAQLERERARAEGHARELRAFSDVLLACRVRSTGFMRRGRFNGMVIAPRS